jgi:tetratricopeptide (TPR) repeat protein
LKKLLINFLICFPFLVNSQDKKSVFEQAIQELQANDYQAGIKLLDEVLKQNPKDYPALFNRAVAKSILRKYEEANKDINLAIAIKPDAKKAYLHRGIIRKKLTDYEGALADFDFATKLDPKFADAFYNKGVLFELLGKFDEACIEFTKAKEAGSAAAYPKVEFCETPINERVKVNSILRLEQTTTDKSYGFSPKNPIKVGTGSNGGQENEQTYLDLLRDDTAAPISYVLKGKCCDYFTKNATAGKGYLSQYEITYLQKDGKSKTTSLYLSQFDYESPKIIVGFSTIRSPK